MSMPRFHVPGPLQSGQSLQLPEGPSRHAQVLRLQPGSSLVLFDGEGGQWQALVEDMGRKHVRVGVGSPLPADPGLEPACSVTVALGMPANDRMDFLIEKATELGVAAVQPLMCERSVLRLSGERAERKRAHWRAIAVSACEQSGRSRVPDVAPVATLAAWLGSLGQPVRSGERRVLLSTTEAPPLPRLIGRAPWPPSVLALSGPEGGLSDAEHAAAVAAGFEPASLGARILRADTAPLALLSWLGVDGLG